MKKQFLWEKQIDGINNNIITLKDGTEVELTEKQMKYMISDKSVDASKQREILLDTVVPEILMILEEHDVMQGDIQAIRQTVVDSYDRSYMIALGKAFGTYEPNKPFQSLRDAIRVSDIKRLMKS